MTKKYNGGSKSATFKSEKLPAFQFYPGDWKRDLGVQSLNYEERGVWFELLLMMHEAEDRGKLSINGAAIDDKTLAKLLQIAPQTWTKVLRNLLQRGVISREDDTGILYSRRMVRDEEFRQKRIEWGYLGAEHGIKGGRPKGSKNNPLDGFEKNPPSSSSSSSSSISYKNKEEEIYKSPLLPILAVCEEPPANPDDVKVSGKLFPEIYLSANERKKIKANYAKDGLGDEAVTLGLETLQHYAINHSAKFKKYKSHYLVMIGWVKVEVKKKIKQDLDLSRSQIYAVKAQISQFTN